MYIKKNHAITLLNGTTDLPKLNTNKDRSYFMNSPIDVYRGTTISNNKKESILASDTSLLSLHLFPFGFLRVPLISRALGKTWNGKCTGKGGNYFISRFGISPERLIHIHGDAQPLRLRNATYRDRVGYLKIQA